MYNFYFCLCRGELGAVRDWCSALHLLQNSCSHDKYLSFLPEHLFGFTAEGSSQSPEQLLTGTLPGLISAYWGKGGSEFAGISVPNIPCLCFVLLRVSLLFFHLHLVMWSVCFFSHSFSFISNLCKTSFGDCQVTFWFRWSLFLCIFLLLLRSLSLWTESPGLLHSAFFPLVAMRMWFEAYNLVPFKIWEAQVIHFLSCQIHYIT